MPIPMPRVGEISWVYFHLNPFSLTEKHHLVTFVLLFTVIGGLIDYDGSFLLTLVCKALLILVLVIAIVNDTCKLS